MHSQSDSATFGTVRAQQPPPSAVTNQLATIQYTAPAGALLYGAASLFNGHAPSSAGLLQRFAPPL